MMLTSLAHPKISIRLLIVSGLVKAMQFSEVYNRQTKHSKMTTEFLQTQRQYTLHRTLRIEPSFRAVLV